MIANQMKNFTMGHMIMFKNISKNMALMLSKHNYTENSQVSKVESFKQKVQT